MSDRSQLSDEQRAAVAAELRKLYNELGGGQDAHGRQSKVAGEVGVTPQSISKAEKGQFGIYVANKIAEYRKVTLDELVARHFGRTTARAPTEKERAIFFWDGVALPETIAEARAGQDGNTQQRNRFFWFSFIQRRDEELREGQAKQASEAQGAVKKTASK